MIANFHRRERDELAQRDEGQKRAGNQTTDQAEQAGQNRDQKHPPERAEVALRAHQKHAADFFVVLFRVFERKIRDDVADTNQ